MPNQRRTVITGLGVISPLGVSKESFWQSLFEGKSNFKPITLFDTSSLKVKTGGEITDFDPKPILGTQGLMDLDRATLLLLSATKLALDDARLTITEENSNLIGVSIGTTFGSLHSLSAFDRESLRDGPRYVNPSVFPSTVGNSPASRISIRFNIKGSNTTISTGMCAGLDAFDYSRDLIELNRTNTIITGSVEDFSMQTFLGFYKLNYLSGLNGNSEVVSRPFDKRRNGIVFSEGATAFILEELDSARFRKATPCVELLGVGTSFDPTKYYRYNPKGIGIAKAMHLALQDAQLDLQDIDCIFANANSTKDADVIETRAIKEVFAGHAQKIPITSIKSTLGETFSASGSFAVLAAIGAIRSSLIPPTTHYKEKDPDCDLNYVVNSPLKKKLERVMVNAFGPNGESTVLIIGKFQERV